MPQQVPHPGNAAAAAAEEPPHLTAAAAAAAAASDAGELRTPEVGGSNFGAEAGKPGAEATSGAGQVRANGCLGGGGASKQSTQVANSNAAEPVTAAVSANNGNSNTNNTTPNNNNGNTNKPLAGAKQNGLRNRIIQRPPPLILDKVSNFYDTGSTRQQVALSPPPAAAAAAAALKQPASDTGEHAPAKTSTLLRNQNGNHQQVTVSNAAQHRDPTVQGNSKFWASLNQNASQRKSQPPPPPPAQHNSLDCGPSSLDNNKRQPPPPPPPHQVFDGVAAAGKEATVALGPDLVISHRSHTNAAAAAASSQKPAIHTATNRISTSTALMLQQKHQSALATTPKSDQDSLLTDEPPANQYLHLFSETPKPTASHDMSNNSEHDDSSAQGVASESGGGNLIGVDNSPPPPPPDLETASRVHFHSSNNSSASSPPNQQSSNSALQLTARRQPKSNNPFLTPAEESQSSPKQATSANHNHSQPLTAHPYGTSKGPMITNNHYQQQQQQQLNSMLDRLLISDANLSTNSAYDDQNQHQHYDDQPIYQMHHQPHLPPQFRPALHPEQSLNQDNHYSRQPPTTVENLYGTTGLQPNQVADQNDGLPRHQPTIPGGPLGANSETVYGTIRNQANQHQHQNYVNYEPTMSINSESANCEAPASVSLQLPYWTDAIYTLNNAILDSSSVAGGAENGEFIYVIENGDIILELDQTKVSGYTLAEFRDLLESKPMHLLSAVQTKHSHGLTKDLKRYLMCDFPKNSPDKLQQDLIRENIYRRTIPCTTRPPREGEQDKVDYHFLTKEHFIEMNNRGMLLECGIHGGHYYGTMKPFSDRDSLTMYGTLGHREMSEDMQQPLNANHPAIGLNPKKQIPSAASLPPPDTNPLYENHETLQRHQSLQASSHNMNVQSWLTNKDPNQNGLQADQVSTHYGHLNQIPYLPASAQPRSSVAPVNPEALPPGWEKVYDRVHGTYYIDHNTQSSQYERPYEIELTKGAIGFGFTLVEADNGVLLVRSIIPGGPAHASGIIKPGDILLSAVGVPVANLQHTDIARLFSTFAVGDRVRMTFARSTYIVDSNLVPDEYLISNGTNGDLAIAYNVDPNMQQFNQEQHMLHNQSLGHNHSNIEVLDYDILSVCLRRGETGFGFTIVDPGDGLQHVKEIQNSETGMKLMKGDILVELDGKDISRLPHKEVVDKLKQYPIGQEVILTVRRKRSNMMPLRSSSERVQSRFAEYAPIGASSDYHSMPVYTNSIMLKNDPTMLPLPVKPTMSDYDMGEYLQPNDLPSNYYANNKEIALQRVQYNHPNEPSQYPVANYGPRNGNFPQQLFDPEYREDEYEYHEVYLDRDSRDSNWGIRLIGGAEVDRAISIGSIVFGGAASKNGKLKSGDEIISINGYNVVGATHQHVVDLISTCANQACLVVRRKKFAEACEVLLTRSMDEGFGFVIISSLNCALIGSIIEGSPADRCKQLHVKDQIIAVNGNYITPDMQHPDIVNLIKDCGSTLRLRIIPADCYTVELIKNSLQDNFGFSIRGGSEYDGTPLYILRVAPKGLARDLLNVGDQIIEINNLSTVGMTHQQAATIIKYSDPIVKLKLRRNHVIPPSLLVASPKELATYNQVTAEMKTVSQMTTPNHLQDA